MVAHGGDLSTVATDGLAQCDCNDTNLVLDNREKLCYQSIMRCFYYHQEFSVQVSQDHVIFIMAVAVICVL